MKKFDNQEGLDSPLVVHKKTDSSYQSNSNAVDVNTTHEKQDTETLERHRFKKEKKNNNLLLPIILIIMIVVGVVFALYFSGVIGNRQEKEMLQSVNTTTECVTTLEEKYKDTIVIKDDYIFVDGYEVDGIDGLQTAIKYEDVSPTRYTIIQENVNENYYNNEVLPMLTDLGFYDKSTKINVVHSTGLMAESEKTELLETEQTTTEQSVQSTQSNQE